MREKMDMQNIGYFLYMEEQERAQQEKVNVKTSLDLVGEKATEKEKEKQKK